MLKYRLPSGVFLGAVILTSIFWEGDAGRYVFFCAGAFLAFAAVKEFLGMLDKMGMRSFSTASSLISALVLGGMIMELPLVAFVSAGMAVAVLSWLSLLPPANRRDSVSKMVNSLSVFPLLVFPLSFLALIYNFDGGSANGRYLLFFMILTTKFGDIGAYTVGMLTARLMSGGNHKILPRISPKKSWEGTIGGLATSVGASFAFCHFVPGMVFGDLGPILFPLLTGSLLFIGGFLGDLVESSLKRAAEVKDSGNMIPGMGGALDVIDSLILNAPLFYMFIVSCQA